MSIFPAFPLCARIVEVAEVDIVQADVPTTSPHISIPASARAALAAILAAATAEGSPSASRTVMNMSIVDFGKSSSRTDGRRD